MEIISSLIAAKIGPLGLQFLWLCTASFPSKAMNISSVGVGRHYQPYLIEVGQ